MFTWKYNCPEGFETSVRSNEQDQGVVTSIACSGCVVEETGNPVIHKQKIPEPPKETDTK